MTQFILTLVLHHLISFASWDWHSILVHHHRSFRFLLLPLLVRSTGGRSSSFSVVAFPHRRTGHLAVEQLALYTVRLRVTDTINSWSKSWSIVKPGTIKSAEIFQPPLHDQANNLIPRPDRLRHSRGCDLDATHTCAGIVQLLLPSTGWLAHAHSASLAVHIHLLSWRCRVDVRTLLLAGTRGVSDLLARDQAANLLLCPSCRASSELVVAGLNTSLVLF